MKKVLMIGVIALITWIASMFVWAVVSDRSSRYEEASYALGKQWGDAQTIAGPFLAVPVVVNSVNERNEAITVKKTLYLFPSETNITAKADTETRRRGIYSLPVYTATVDASGSFDLANINELIPSGATPQWNEAVVGISVSDAARVAGDATFTWDNSPISLAPLPRYGVLGGTGVHAAIVLDPKQTTHTFSYALPMRGSKELMFAGVGTETNVAMQANWQTPNFQGIALPREHSESDQGFTASWVEQSFSNQFRALLADDPDRQYYELTGNTFGVSFREAVTFYTLVDRVTKYSILFIALTFLTLFMYEILARVRIHPIQYLLVGSAIALFYLMLLSLAEVVGFLPAYIGAAAAITLLVTMYSANVLARRGRALVVGSVFVLLYTYLYILLRLEEYSLLVGSLLLFAVLAFVMYATRNLNWYEMEMRENDPRE